MEKIIKRNEKIVWRIVDGTAFLINTEKNVFYRLNETGTFIWESLKTPENISKIVEDVCDEFEIDEKTVKKDVDKFIVEMLNSKIIEKGNNK